MKKSLTLAVAIAAALLAGCGQVDSVVSSAKSTVGMLDRTVTVYNANGGVIKVWQTTNQIEYAGPVAAFIDKNGTNVRVSGTFIIEGK